MVLYSVVFYCYIISYVLSCLVYQQVSKVEGS